MVTIVHTYTSVVYHRRLVLWLHRIQRRGSFGTATSSKHDPVVRDQFACLSNLEDDDDDGPLENQMKVQWIGQTTL